MGLKVSLSANTVVQQSVNDVLQVASNTCLARCEPTAENVRIIIDNGSQIGDVTITQTCNVDSLCSMKTSLESISTQQLESIQASQAINQDSPSLLTWPSIGIAGAVNMTFQSLQNTVTQVIDNNCEAVSQQTARNILVYANDNSQVGGFTLTQESSVTAQCAMESSGSVLNSQTAFTDQYASSGNGSMIIIIIGVILVALMAFAFLLLKLYLDAEAKRKMELLKTDTLKDVLKFGTEKENLTESQIDRILDIASDKLGYSKPETVPDMTTDIELQPLTTATDTT